ncbi:MAG TPA: lipopolysaccharide assembly protein LapB [Burkholderiaceae bacterium]|nr:lipopolysaccharide assembly protein LapB [Burkholderiaceae bacterium]
MEFELWWLGVIPLFFGLGWAAARIDARHLIRASSRLPDAYFKGLNFLLNEQPDKAIDAFVDVVKLDPETVELHFALGNLFRRRGETDRAIRVHQSLLARSDLQPAQREHALFELGQDFLRAGLLDRAEDAFVKLEGSGYAAAALRHRLDIAQMVRDWPRAIELARRLQRDGGGDLDPLITHFRCELAQQALAGTAGDAAERREQARRELDRAFETGAAHPRPWLVRGEAALAADEPEAAIEAWSELVRTSPAHLALAGERWLQAHERIGRLDEGLVRLEQVLHEHPSVDTLRAIARGRAERDGPEAAIAWLREALGQAPSLLGLQQLLELQRAGEGADGATDAALTAALIKRQAERLARFVCGHCGFKARRFYWQCPGCNHWDSYPPRRTEELEA